MSKPTINNHSYESSLMLEITILSAEGLKNTPFFSQRLRPFVTVSTDPPIRDGVSCRRRTVVDETGGRNPTWGERFEIPIDAPFISQRHASVYLEIYSERLVLGKTRLGWCQIPVTDIVDGWRPAGLVRHLSYRVRARDGLRGEGVVNVAARLVGSLGGGSPGVTWFPAVDVGQTAIGIPVTFVL